MIVKLPTDHILMFLILTGGCTGSSESTHVKMPHCWKSRVAAHLFLFLCLRAYMHVCLFEDIFGSAGEAFLLFFK